MVGDLMLVSNNYFDRSNFLSKSEIENPFSETSADSLILADKTNFRVFEVQGRLQARTSFFHKSVGGYSAVRPRRFDQIFDYVVDDKMSDLASTINQKDMTLTKNLPILSALNVKYLLFAAKDGNVPIQNPFANGDAWFVSELKNVATADAEMQAIKLLDLKNIAVANTVLYRSELPNQTFEKDSLAKINLDVYKPNYIKYNTFNTKNGLAVFSEMFYPKGWNVFIDGKPSTHFRVDYVLRAMQIPAGNHVVEFKFEPTVVKTGSIIALISFVFMIILTIFGIYYFWKTQFKKLKS